MTALLKHGAMTPGAIAQEIEANLESVTRTLRRYKKVFVLVDNDRFGLLERTSA
jgi:hypothetical protein